MSKKTVWHDEEIIPKAMYDAASGKIAGWLPLEFSDHFNSLKTSLELCEGAKSLLDLGCGAGEVGRVFNNFIYTGADLPHIIKKVALKKNPNKNFLSFDINYDDCNFINNYDIVLMNSFLSEIPDFFEILIKVLLVSKKYVIIHRHEFTDENTRKEKYKTYSDFQTFKNVINWNDFLDCCLKNKFIIDFETESIKTTKKLKTIVLKRGDNV